MNYRASRRENFWKETQVTVVSAGLTKTYAPKKLKILRMFVVHN